MTLREALLASKENGLAYHSGNHGWVKWDEQHAYRFSCLALVADDWEMVGEPEAAQP